MKTKFNLRQMRLEIQEDENLRKEKEGYWASQDEISEIIARRKREKK
jgi:hypothetical protein